MTRMRREGKENKRGIREDNIEEKKRMKGNEEYEKTGREEEEKKRMHE